jgi:hypothetical protein
MRFAKGTKLTCPADVAYETAVAVLRANDAVAEGRRIDFERVSSRCSSRTHCEYSHEPVRTRAVILSAARNL